MDKLDKRINKNIKKIRKGIAIIKERCKNKPLKDSRLLDKLESNLNNPKKLIEIFQKSDYPTIEQSEDYDSSIFGQTVEMDGYAENFSDPFDDLVEIFTYHKK